MSGFTKSLPDANQEPPSEFAKRWDTGWKKPHKRELRPELSSGYFVYIVEATIDQHVWSKIGMSNELCARLSGIQCGCPIRLSRVFYADVESKGEAELVEKYLHTLMYDHHSSGEWFSFAADENKLAELASLAAGVDAQIVWKSFPITELRKKKEGWKEKSLEAKQRQLERIRERKEEERIERERIEKIKAHVPRPIITYMRSRKNRHLKGAA